MPVLSDESQVTDCVPRSHEPLARPPPTFEIDGAVLSLTSTEMSQTDMYATDGLTAIVEHEPKLGAPQRTSKRTLGVPTPTSMRCAAKHWLKLAGAWQPQAQLLFVLM